MNGSIVSGTDRIRSLLASVGPSTVTSELGSVDGYAI
jgi:hypothetical protein